MRGKSSPYAENAMTWAVAVGLIRGMGNNTLQPLGLSTRGQFATVVYRFFHVEINLMATSDIHGQAYATDYTADYSASGTHYQGLTRVATFVKQQRQAYVNSFLVDCGDLVQGTPPHLLLRLQPSRNKRSHYEGPADDGLRHVRPGNHEFNYGMTILQRQLNYLTSDGTETESPGCGLRQLPGFHKQGGETTNWSTWNGYAPYQLYDYNYVTVAVMGIATPISPSGTSRQLGRASISPTSLRPTKHYEQEMTEKADLIVLASHSGIDSDAQSDFIRRLVSETNSIDLVFSGHEHRNGITQIANSDGKGNPRVLPVHQGSCGGQAM